MRALLTGTTTRTASTLHVVLCTYYSVQALLFDEDYDSHSFYEYRKARRWIASAKAPLIGTSYFMRRTA